MQTPWSVYETPEHAAKRRVRYDANFVGYILLSLLAAQLVVSIAYVVLEQFGISESSLGNTAQVLLNMGLYALYFIFPVFLTAKLAGRRALSVARRRVGARVLVLSLFGGMMLAVLANFAASILMQMLMEWGVPKPFIPDHTEGTTTSLLLNLAGTALVPAVFEELAFRGYVLNALRPHGDKVAVWVSAAVFGLIHGNVLQLPFALILGLVLGWLVVQTDSLLPAMVLHFANNAMSVLLSYVESSGWDGNVATTLVFLALSVAGMCAWCAAFLWNRGHTDLLRPMSNGWSPLTVAQRTGGVLTAPAMGIGVVIWLLLITATSVG